MKQKLLRIIPVFVSIVTVFSLVPSHSVGAAPSNIYLTPATGSYNPGVSFSTQVRGSSDTTYYQQGKTSGTITFPAARLRVNSVSTSGSSYPNINVSFNNSAGTITWSGAAYPSPTTIYFFTINFQTLSAGSAPVAFSADTNVNHSSYYQITSTNKTNATYTIVNPPPATCPAGQVGTPPNCSTPPPATCPAGQVGTPPNCAKPPTSGGGTQTPTPAPTAPTVSDTVVPTPTAQPDVAPVQVDAGDLSIKDVVAKVTRQSNALTWKTSLAEVTTELALGTSKENLTVKPTVEKQPDGSYLSSMENLKPGVRYYFMITATAKDNAEKKATFSGAFTTRGYPVKIVVTKDGKKVSGASVTIEKQTFKTEKNGELALELTDTAFTAAISSPDSQTKKNVSFTVAKKTIPTNGGEPETQTFTFDLSEQTPASTTGPSLLWPILGAIGGGIGLLLAGALFLFYRRRKAEQNASPAVSEAESYTNWGEQQTLAPNLDPPVYVRSDQQAAELASIEQQFIPETEPQPQDIYEAQSITPPGTELTTAPAELSSEYTETVVEQVPQTVPIESSYTEPPSEAVPLPTEQEFPIPSEQAGTASFSETTAEDTSALVTSSPQPADTILDDDLPQEEEEAVYHPDTGELDIIHSHHTQAPTTSITLPEPPAPEVRAENADAQNLPLPPEVSADTQSDNPIANPAKRGVTV